MAEYWRDCPRINSNGSSDDVPKYKKKATRSVKKADHKHEYINCVFEVSGPRLDGAHGIVYDRPELTIGTFCRHCGKIGSRCDGAWINDRREAFGDMRKFWKPDALREFNVNSRTLPYFHIDSIWQKEVAVCDHDDR